VCVTHWPNSQSSILPNCRGCRFTFSIGGRPQVSLGGWFLFFRLRPCGVLFCAVASLKSLSVSLFRTVQYSSFPLGGCVILRRWRQLFV